MTRKSFSGPLKGVIFDWAGTTVDYGCFAPVAVFIEVFAKRGIEVNIAQARAPMGLAKKDHIRAIAAMEPVATAWRKKFGFACNEADVENMFVDSVALQTGLVLEYTALIPGTLETVAFCRENGLKIGSSTGYSRSIMDVLVPEAERQGYRPDSIICPSDVPAGRPAPWMVYLNAMKMEIYPPAALVKVGDTVPDIEEGLNAGTWTVGLTKTGNELGLSRAEVAGLSQSELENRLLKIEERLYQAGAHFVIEEIGQLPLVLTKINELLKNGERPV